MYSLHYEKFANGSVKCIEDEIPFEVPEGWGWCRLTEITFEIFAGGDKPENYSKTQTDEFSIPIFANGTENDGLYGFTNKARVNKSAITVSARGTIGFCCIRHMPFVPIVRLITIVPAEGINIEYLRIVFQALIETGEGSSIPQLTVPGIKPKLIPIPPYSEQTRISNKLIETEKIVSAVELNQESVVNYIKLAKSKILDLAIRGQLVPQDPNDEPASVLLERIRAEKEELIKAGKIKRDKKESIIFKGDDNSYYEKVGKVIKNIDDEIPFTIPDSWKWCRLKAICKKIVDGSHNPPKGLDFVTPYIMASSRNIIENTISDLSNVRYLDKENFIKEHSRTNVEINDILLTTVATLGRSCIYKGKPENLCFQRSVTVITSCILQTYLKLFFDAPYFQNFIVKSATGTAQKGFYLNQLENVLICIPPLAEQDKISCGISSIFYDLDLIEKSLN